MQGLEYFKEKCYNYNCIKIHKSRLCNLYLDKRETRKGNKMDQNQNNENQSAFNNISNENLQNNLNQQVSQTNVNTQNTPMADPFFEEYQTPVYATEFKPLKKRLNPLVIILPVAAVIIAAVVLFIFLFNKTDYKKSERKYFDSILSTALASVEEKEKNPNPQNVSVNFQSPLSNLTGNILDISNIDITFDQAIKGNDIYSTAGYKMDDIDISCEYWLNSAKQYALLNFPGISEIYLKLDLNAKANETTTAETSECIRVFGDVIAKTSDTYFELIGDVPVEKDQEFVVGVKTYTADKAEIHLNAQQIAKISKAFYNNLLDNEEAVKLLCDSLGYENRDELKNAIDENIDFDELNEAEFGKEYPWSVDMTVYLKNKEIIGRNITVKDEDEEWGVEFYNIPTEKGSVAFVSASEEGKSQFSLLNEDNADGDVHNGTISITAGSFEATLTYTDFAVTDTLFQGKADLSVKDNPAFAASLELKTEGEAKNTVITVPNVFTMTIKSEPSALEYKDEPQVPDSQLAVIKNDESNEENEKFNEFMNDILEYINKFTGYDDLYDDDFHGFDD